MRGFPAGGLDKRKAGKQAPVQLIGVGRFQEHLSEFFGRTLTLTKEVA
jgi:hypothetical protein